MLKPLSVWSLITAEIGNYTQPARPFGHTLSSLQQRKKWEGLRRESLEAREMEILAPQELRAGRHCLGPDFTSVYPGEL